MAQPKRFLRMRHLVGFDCGLGFIVLMAAGCGQLAPFGPTPEPVTLTFSYPGGEQDFFEAVIQEFNQEYPHITINLVEQGFGESAPPDVLTISSFSINGLVEDQEIIALDPLIEQTSSQDVEDIYPGVLDLFTLDGKTWAFPVGVDMYVMHYNQDLFDQYGVSYPDMDWSWGDFLEIAQALRDPGAGTFGFAATGEPLEIVTFIYQNNGSLFDDVQNPSRTTFNDPLNVGALEWYTDLVHFYDVAPTALQRLEEWGSGSAMSVGIVSNKIGMWMDGFSQRGSVFGEIELPMQWGVAPLPVGARPLTFAQAFGYAISAGTEYADAAWQWIAFLSKHPLNRLIPARVSVTESEAYEKLVGIEIAEVARTSLERMVILNERTFPDQFQREFGLLVNAFQQAYEGDLTAQEALDQAQEQAESLNP